MEPLFKSRAPSTVECEAVDALILAKEMEVATQMFNRILNGFVTVALDAVSKRRTILSNSLRVPV